MVFSLIYGFGFAVNSVATVPTWLSHDQMAAGNLVGLCLIALGNGGIKPCIAAFGGDQIPEDQVRLLSNVLCRLKNKISKAAIHK